MSLWIRALRTLGSPCIPCLLYLDPTSTEFAVADDTSIAIANSQAGAAISGSSHWTWKARTSPSFRPAFSASSHSRSPMEHQVAHLFSGGVI